MINKIYLIAVVLVFAGCEIVPTKVAETQKRDLYQVVEKTQRPLELTENTVVLDVRSAFDYGLNRVQNSLSLPWENLAEKASSGEVLRDVHQASLRLSLLGLTPQTPVVVVGYGPLGRGEEGRVAWTLLYLGFQDVQVSSIEAFRSSWTQRSSPPALNVPDFPVNKREELQIGRTEFMKLTSDRNEHVVLIDVRAAKEYDANYSAHLPTLNIEWKQFYTGQGRPDWRFKEKLKALEINPDDRVILISNRGVRSAAATYALLALGYARAQNFTAGWNGL